MNRLSFFQGIRPAYLLLGIFLASNTLVLGQSLSYLQRFPESASGMFAKSTSVASDVEGRIYIANPQAAVIQVMDPKGQFLSPISSFGSYQLAAPSIVAVGRNGSLYCYDGTAGLLLSRDREGKSRIIARKGSATGEVEDVKAIAADDRGIVYVLNGAKKQIDIFLPEGHYLTWCSGGIDEFKNPLCLGISAANELYVLEGEGPSVVIFDVNLRQINFHRNVTSKEGVYLSEPRAMAVAANGDFFLLDGKTARITHLNQRGQVLGSTGSKGKASPSIFENPAALAITKDENLAVLDISASQIQVFSAESGSIRRNPESREISFKALKSTRSGLLDIAVSSKGNRYGIPCNARDKVIAYADTGRREAFVINNMFKEASDLDIDSQNRLYVVNRDNREVLVFDENGVLQRKFGKETPQKLKDPSSIKIQKDGTILLCDKGNGFIHKWNAQGVYQKIIISTDNSPLQGPVSLQLDSKDRIYIWDEKANCIYRAASSGWPLELSRLFAKPSKSGSSPGQISSFFVDGLDHIYLFNADTKQIEVYTWGVDPEMICSVGFDGEGLFGFAGAEKFHFDGSSFIAYASAKDCSLYRAVQFLVKPPAPDANVSFNVSEGRLALVYNKSEFTSVTAYGLLTDDRLGRDSIAVRSDGKMLLLDESNLKDDKLHTYSFVSLSNNAASDPALSFNNYLGYGDRMLVKGDWQEALTAYQNAVDRLGASPGMKKYCAEKLCEGSETLRLTSRLGMAASFVEQAFLFAPDEPLVRSKVRNVFCDYFKELISLGELAELSERAFEWQKIKGMKPLVFEALDSLTSYLHSLESRSAFEQSVFVGRNLLRWDNRCLQCAVELSNSLFGLYTLRAETGAPSLELEALISEALSYASQAAEGMKISGMNRVETELLRLKILNAGGRCQEASRFGQAALAELSDVLQLRQELDIREEVAVAAMACGLYGQAVLDFKNMLLEDAGNTRYKRYLAEALTAEGSYQQSRDIYSSLMAADARNPIWSARIGELELLRENFAEASFQLEKAVKQDPTARAFYAPLAKAFDGMENYRNALENYLVALAFIDDQLAKAPYRISSIKELEVLKSDRRAMILRMATLYDRIGEYDVAIDFWRMILKDNPTDPEALLGMGSSALKTGRVYDAVNAFATGFNNDRSNKVFENEYNNALKLRAEVARNEAALSIMEVKAHPVFPSLYRNYADVGTLPLGEIIIANNTDVPITPTAVSVFVKEIMDEPTRLKAPAMVGYSNTYFRLSAIFSDRILEFTEDQIVQMQVVVEYNYGGVAKSATRNVSLSLHGRNTISWLDKRRLAAFAAPSVEGLVDFTKSVGTSVKDQATYNLNPAMLKAMELYTFLHFSGFSYSPDPVLNFAQVSVQTGMTDFMQYPFETIKRGGGDCDDLVTLFASLFENAGIGAAYIDVPGHVFVAFDSGLRPDQLPASGFNENDVIITKDKVWVPLEVTLIGKHGFMTAWKDGASRYNNELKAGRYPELVSLEDARKVYRPSVYWPKGLSLKVSPGSDFVNAYNNQVAELLLKVNMNAIKKLESRYKIEPSNVFVMNEYAFLLAQTGQVEKAKLILHEALGISPANAILLNNLGNISLREGYTTKAIEYYSLASVVDTEDGEILINLCRAYLKAGDKKNAALAFNKAISMNAELNNLYDDLRIKLQ